MAIKCDLLIEHMFTLNYYSSRCINFHANFTIYCMHLQKFKKHEKTSSLFTVRQFNFKRSTKYADLSTQRSQPPKTKDERGYSWLMNAEARLAMYNWKEEAEEEDVSNWRQCICFNGADTKHCACHWRTAAQERTLLKPDTVDISTISTD